MSEMLGWYGYEQAEKSAQLHKEKLSLCSSPDATRDNESSSPNLNNSISGKSRYHTMGGFQNLKTKYFKKNTQGRKSPVDLAKKFKIEDAKKKIVNRKFLLKPRIIVLNKMYPVIG